MPEVPAKFLNFISRLKGVQERKSGTSWSACCPAHEDDKPSLSINIGQSGNLVVSCHSPQACSAPEIMKAVGLTMGDLFASDKPGYERAATRTRRRADAVHSYQYEDGSLAYETCRYSNPKDFAQRRPNPAWKPRGTEPRYIWNLEGVRLVLYRLPNILAALTEKPDRWIALTEGEKCAESLEALGIVATTHPLGAEHWHPRYAESLAGSRVAVFYDLDPCNQKTRKRPGQLWAVQVARDLYAVGCQVRIVRPPKCVDDSKDDVADYILRESRAGTKPDAIKRELFSAIQTATDYFPGWENMTGYESLQSSHRRELAKPGEADMRDAFEQIQRRLRAAVDGVQLDSLPSDLAEVAAWCAWLAEFVSPRLARKNIELGESVAVPVELNPTQTSEPEGNPDATQEAATAQNPDEALCIPAEVGSGVLDVPPEAAGQEPEPI